MGCIENGFSWVNGTCKLGVQGNSIFFLIARRERCATHLAFVCGRFPGPEYNVPIFLQQIGILGFAMNLYPPRVPSPYFDNREQLIEKKNASGLEKKKNRFHLFLCQIFSTFVPLVAMELPTYRARPSFIQHTHIYIHTFAGRVYGLSSIFEMPAGELSYRR